MSDNEWRLVRTIGEPSTIRAVAPAPDGSPLVAAATERGLLRVWDVTTGRQHGRDCTDDGGAGRTALLASAGGPLVASGSGNEGTVRIWDPATGGQVGEPVTDAGWSPAIAATVVGGRSLLLAGRLDGSLRVWEPASRQAPHALHRGPELRVLALDAAHGLAAAVTGTAGDDSGPVRVWSLPGGEPVGAPFAADAEVHAVAVALLGGRPVAVTAGWDRTVRVWDARTGGQLGAPLVDTCGARHVAVGVLAGRPVAVTAGRGDGADAVRVWDLDDRSQVGADLTFPSPVRAAAIAGGALVVAVGSDIAVLTHPRRTDEQG